MKYLSAHGLEVGKFYSKEEIERAFETDFGHGIKGITLRRTEDGEPYILLFSTPGGQLAYGDHVIGDTFYYRGEGMDGDQQFTAANKALSNSNIDGRRIFGFRQEEQRGPFRYLGLVAVEDWAYVDDGGRKVYEFRLRQEGIADVPENTEEGRQIMEISLLPDVKLTDDSARTQKTYSAIARRAAFGLGIKKIYDRRCAVCGRQRFTAAGYPEVHAAHIYPKELKGSDDLRNGIALCRLHHWGFDGGLISISDELTVLVNKAILENTEYEQIYKHKGSKLLVPEPEHFTPNGIFIAAHRELHNF